MAEGKVVDVVCLDFSKVFDSLFQEKLSAHGLNGRILHWMKSSLDVQKRIRGW